MKGGAAVVYVAFGEALGRMEIPPNSDSYVLMDVHGAGAQRSDPKSGDPADYPHGFGPQGEVRRIYNYARMFRDDPSVVSAIKDTSDSSNAPQEYQLAQNYPNPFNPVTAISFSLPRAGRVSLEIYNLLGEKVATLVDDQLAEGNHTYHWVAAEAASGIYYYVLTSGSTRMIRKMLLLR